ncbi:FAD-dependent oxidoreductase [Parvicella tangerina]|uniref:Kynurenine 3-monooxygenase n=1 Tax=Parvicella tangerina TaxID=2829795 RepID=A0A916JJ39_9FLAO|nr:NAD(P)/FAD-dependent oxidoreductase [Parvicella tangerina]CAG5076469.1 Kynurenine 3-monooxygenase [Parvicella tangerina]
MKTGTIVGAGLAGSLWAVYLAKAGYKVTVFERRPDIRKAEISAGKSINLALSERGWTALREVGLDRMVEDLAIPMYGRIMHDEKAKLTFQPYGEEGQAIFSVSRGGINARMMDAAEQSGDVTIHYNHQCVDVDFENTKVTLLNKETNETIEHQSDVVFACDGAFSAVRYNGFQKVDRFNFSQNYIADGYREILLPANEDGSYKLDKNALHIWPRGEFMLIALANEDGSFTCTLFMPFENHEYSFDKLNSRDDVDQFFREVFPDFHAMMPDVADQWETHPLSSLALMRCYPWTHENFALLGDAAHATVPFYGQGMNASMEDCYVMGQLMKKHNENWTEVFKEYQEVRKPNGDALQDLSVHNYKVMRDLVADPHFLLKKKFEHRIHDLYPEKYLSLYSMVSFSNIPYAEAMQKGKEQDDFIEKIMRENDIEARFENDTIDELIHSIFQAEAV